MTVTPETATARPSFADTLAVYLKPRVLIVLFLGFSAGLPLALSSSTLLVWMREVGVDLGVIGLFALVGTPYTIKFLWAPVVDALDAPVLSALFGRRRGWLLFSQLLLIVSIVLLAFSDPARAPWYVVFAAALFVATASATQDIVIDAFRIESLPESQQAAGMAAYVAAYRIGMLASTAGALFLVSGFEDGLGFAKDTAWTAGYLVMAALVVIGIATSFIAREPEKSVVATTEHAEHARENPLVRVAKAAYASFADFLTRDMAIVVLVFVVLYKLCDAFAGAMTAPFVIDLGFSRNDYAAIVKGVGLAATLIGGFAGGALARAYPLVTSLWIGAFLQMASNLIFTWQALVGVNLWALTLTIIVENFTGAIGTVIFVAYLSALCNNPLHTATQYALLTALAAVLHHQRADRSAEPGAAHLAAAARTFHPPCQANAHRDGRLERRALPDRRRERALVEIIEFAADRHAVRKPRHLHIGVVQQVGDVVRRGLSVDRGVERKDYRGHRRIVGARHKRVDRKILRTDAVEGRERAAQHVIAGIDRVRALERPQVGDVGDGDNDGGIAPRIGADRAGILGVDIAAHSADLDFFERGLHRRGERRHDLLALLDQKQRRAARRAGPEPRQAGEQGDQTLDLGSGGSGGHERRRPATGYCMAVDAGGARSAAIN